MAGQGVEGSITVIDYQDDQRAPSISAIQSFDDASNLSVIDLGPSGIVPPVAEFHTVALLSQRITVQNGILQINRNFGEYVTVRVQSLITTVEVTNWPPIQYLGRIMLEMINEGEYNVAWPDWIIWSRGRKPDLTLNSRDRFILTTSDGGSTVYGDIVGIAYS